MTKTLHLIHLQQQQKKMFAVFVIINSMIHFARHVDTHSVEVVYKTIPQLMNNIYSHIV
jgi:hypothetical protein